LQLSFNFRHLKIPIFAYDSTTAYVIIQIFYKFFNYF